MKNNYCTFYIVRHGETVLNVQKRVQGHLDSPLTPLGLKQVKKLAQKLKKIRFDAIFSSDLLRAKKTAQIIALEHKLAVATTKALRERKMGKLDGRPWELLDKYYKKFEDLDNQTRFKTPLRYDVESDEAIIGRVITFLREIAISQPGKTILIATHGGLMKTLLIHLGFGTYDNFYGSFIENTAYFQLLSDGIDFFIKETFGIHKPGEIK